MTPSIIKTALIAVALTLAATLAPAAESKPAPAASSPAVKLIDINSAKKDELKTLPGVTDAEADKIIAGRPYLSKAHLVTRNIISAGAYENIRMQVIARPKRAPAAKPAQK